MRYEVHNFTTPTDSFVFASDDKAEANRVCQEWQAAWPSNDYRVCDGALISITIAGYARGDAWGSMLGDDTAGIEMQFVKDFIAPGAPPSPWQADWPGIREALDDVSSSGDLIGGRGDIVEATISFNYASPGKRWQSIHTLQPTKATADLWERETEHA